MNNTHSPSGENAVRVLAFLQNTWVRDVARCEEVLERHASAPITGHTALQMRRHFTAAWLFMGCATGRNLKKVFGEDGVYEITWDNASPRLADASSGAFPPDPEHIRAVLEEEQPDVVLVFGKVAESGVLPLWDGPLIVGPHPTARGADTMERLREMAKSLRRFMELGDGRQFGAFH